MQRLVITVAGVAATVTGAAVQAFQTQRQAARPEPTTQIILESPKRERVNRVGDIRLGRGNHNSLENRLDRAALRRRTRKLPRRCLRRHRRASDHPR
jgi:hypothetical protein